MIFRFRWWKKADESESGALAAHMWPGFVEHRERGSLYALPVCEYNPVAVYHNRHHHICTFHAAHSRVKFFFCCAPSFTFRPRRRSERRERMLSNKHTPIYSPALFVLRVSCADADDTERNSPIKTHTFVLFITDATRLAFAFLHTRIWLFYASDTNRACCCRRQQRKRKFGGCI
jgi:hypothetical protein